MANYFNFYEAMQWIDFGETVGIIIDGKTRFYFIDNNEIWCRTGMTTYKVKQFYLDAIQSNEWFLYE